VAQLSQGHSAPPGDRSVKAQGWHVPRHLDSSPKGLAPHLCCVLLSSLNPVLFSSNLNPFGKTPGSWDLFFPVMRTLFVGSPLQLKGPGSHFSLSCYALETSDEISTLADLGVGT
jgi:hypothetical protein